MVEIVYTNLNCQDVFVPFYKQKKKHSNYNLKIISDYNPVIDNNVDIFNYKNDEPYYKVWINALNQFNVENFIYLQEDFYLYNNVNENILNEYLHILNSNEEYSFIRLIKSGQLNNKRIYNNLYEIESSNENIFSMQATIWKTNDYIKLMEEVRDNKWLENDNYRDKMIKLKMKGLYHYDNENKRGGNHYDSNVYPYIATAVVRGKWNLREYRNELIPILMENNINIMNRGEFL